MKELHPLSATRNQLENIHNRYQGDAKRVLCVCSAGLLRSPTLAHVLQQKPYNLNCRAAGVDASHALIPVNEALLTWADLIICVDKWSALTTRHLMLEFDVGTTMLQLNIPDQFERNDPKLVREIKKQLKEVNEKVYQLHG